MVFLYALLLQCVRQLSSTLFIKRFPRNMFTCICIFCRIGRHVGDFESIFLSDLEGGKLVSKESFCGLEGESWMNLDGDLSPICLNIFPLVSSSLHDSTTLQTLPAYILLLSVVERLTNQGSLGGIDALLGCPLCLPSPKASELVTIYTPYNHGTEVWFTRYSVKLKIVYYKKLKRKSSNTSDDGNLKEPTILEVLRRAGAVSQEVPNEGFSDQSCKRTESQHSDCHADSNGPPSVEISAVTKILDGQRFKFRELSVDCLSILTFSRVCIFAHNSLLLRIVSIYLYFDFKPCSKSSLLTQDNCCSDPAAEAILLALGGCGFCLPLHLYLSCELCHNLDCLTRQTKQNSVGCLRVPFSNNKVISDEFVNKIRKLFPSLKKHFDCAVCVLSEGDEICQEHWKFQSASAGNPDIPGLVVFKSSVAGSVFKEVLRCLSKMLNLPDIKMNTPVLLDLLNAFQPIRIPDSLFSGIQPIPSPGNIDYMYCGIFSFLEGVLDSACSYSVLLASEVLVTLESIVSSAQSFLDKLLEGSGKSTHLGFVQKVIPLMRKRLGTYAHQLLTHNWDSENFENGSKSKGEIIQRILHIYFENSESTADLLEEFACSILPQAPSCNTRSSEEAPHGFPTLCYNTCNLVSVSVSGPVNIKLSCIPNLYIRKCLHMELSCAVLKRITIVNKLVKEVTLLEKSRANIQVESVKGVLSKLHQSVSVVVSLVNMCKVHDKVAVHALAVKYGGKFVDSFLKVFDFLQAHFQVHGEIIIQLLKELQKATRTIQTLCSEAKGSKRTMITTKIPAAKRSMERFLFRVKALLHNTSNGCTFWMGNLKHKDLFGQVVSSQLYADENNDIDEDAHVDMDLDVTEQPLSDCSLHDGEDGPVD
ncbi:hypothetical protein IFM89_038262 [Coptis chinensis]|uniref:Fanconi anemia group D2 protein n=1 Tax=Coptis chinensis TaxID=261450 RepID=A0A835H9J8_9MAGN|nr:hypothetical protein IFM89_038262 [Coptis chinensis]